MSNLSKSIFQNYEPPVRANRILNEKDIDEKGVIIRFLKPPIFAWYDLVIQKGENGQKGVKLAEDYYPYENPKEKPKLTKFPEVKGYKGKDRTAKHLWACLVYNQQTGDIQFFQLTNSYYQERILSLDKKGYDLLDTDLHITKTLKPGTKDDYVYDVSPVPPHEQKKLPENIEKQIEEKNVDLNRIFTTGDPFKEVEGEDDEEYEYVNADGTPWNPDQAQAPKAEETKQPEPTPPVQQLPEIDPSTIDDIQTPF